MNDEDHKARFEELILPHLEAAYNLARWLTGSDHDARDVAQEACLRALKYFGGFRGGNARAWLLMIVRNSAFTWMRANRPKEVHATETDELESMEDHSANPELRMNRDATINEVRTAMAGLAYEFRELVVLRELEGLSYKEIAEALEIPIGTVMSRLARARKHLQTALSSKSDGGRP